MSITESNPAILAQPETPFIEASKRYPLGEVTYTSPMSAEKLGIPAHLQPLEIHSVAVTDPIAERYSPEERVEVYSEELAADADAYDRRIAGKWQRKSGTAYETENGELVENKGKWGDPVSSRRFFDRLNSQALENWLSWIPSAEALKWLCLNPEIDSIIENRNPRKPAAGLDETAKKWLALCTDGVAIRSRGTVMAEIVSQFAAEQPEIDDMRYMSVACGTALPTMLGAMKAGITPEMLLVDFDTSAMAATEKLRDEIGYEGKLIRPAQAALGKDDLDIFDSNGEDEMEKLREYLGNNGGRPMVIDLMGIFEYTGKNLDVDPVKFLRDCYDMLHPGGKLIFGQMRADRPVSDFTMGVVSWPVVEMRTPAEFMQIIDDAGISVNATKLFMPTDGVYMVGAIDKPLTPETFNLAA